MFTKYNTEGYSQFKLDKLNEEWQSRVENLQINEEGTEEYEFQLKCFEDEVSSR